MQALAAITEPTRFRIVELLRAGPRPVNEIAADLDLNQPQASKHLRVLRSEGFVEVTPRAQQRVYRLRPERFRALHEWIEGYRDLWEARFDEIDRIIDETKPDRKGRR